MRPNSLKVWSPVLVFLLLSGFFLLASPFPAQAQITCSTPCIYTDQPEYAIGDFAAISGQAFTPGVTVTLEVQRVDNVIDRTDVIAQPDGTFQYVYYLNPNLPDPDAAYRGLLTVRAKVNNAVVATTTFLDNPQWTLQGCSKHGGDCKEKSSGNDWANNGSRMDGWTSGELKGWYEGENVPYRLRVSLPKNSDGNKNYFAVTEHDNLRTGITGIDSMSGFYVGAGPSSVYPQGYQTKSCVQRAAGTGILIPTLGTSCYVSGPTYSGLNDDGYLGDSLIDEDPADGIDNDGDGRIDEDPPMNGSGSNQMIQYTWAVHFNSDEAGNSKKRWAFYWKGHLAVGSSAYPGASLHADASPSGNQDVPIQQGDSCISADLSITKSDSPDPVSAGGTITYTLKVTNNGPHSAKGLTVTDTLPAGTTFVSASGSGWSCSYSGGTVTCTRANSSSQEYEANDDDDDHKFIPDITIVVTAPSPSPDPIMITNTATVSWSGSDPNTSNNTATATTTVNPVPVPVADLSISKVGPPPPGVSAGSLFSYTINVNNLGPQTAPNVTVTDTLPTGTTFVNASGTGWACSQSLGVVTCTMSNLGGSAPPIIIDVTAPTPSFPTTITNKVKVEGSGSDDPVVGNNTAKADTIVSGIAELSIVKTESVDPVLVNGTLFYTLTVTNSGPSNASGVSVSDTLPSGVTFVNASGSGWTCGYSAGTVTCSRASLAVGMGPDITIEVTAPATAGTLSNTATVTAFELDTYTGDNSSTISTTVSPAVDLSITKTDSPDPVNAQGMLTYTISVNNAGPSTGTGITMTDVLPAGTVFGGASGTGWTCTQNSGTVTCTLPSLPVGPAANITITLTAPAEGGSITNTASVSAAETDPYTGNNVSSQSTGVTAIANLSITKTDFPDPVTAGGVLTYTISVSNAGPSTASNLSVSDAIPAGTSYVSSGGTGWLCNNVSGTVTCTRPSLAVGAASNITITVTAPAEGGSISNTATVSATTVDQTPGNNSSTQSTNVTASANLLIAKSDSPDPVTAAGTLTYAITVSNAGPSTASNITVTDTLPAGVTYVNAGGTGWSCNPPSGGQVVCTRASLAVGAAPDISIVVTAPAQSGGIINTADVSSSTNDPNNSNNSTTASTSVTASVDLSIAKADFPDPVTAGQNVTYTITVTNAGPSAATGVTVTDTLPVNGTYVSAVGTGWSCNPPVGGQVVCSRANLAVGTAPDITVVVTAPVEGGSITNTATVTGNEADPIGGNNSAAAITTVSASTDLSITKIDSPDPVTAGGTLTYTINVNNAGPSSATNVTVTDTLPLGVTYVSAGGTGWTCNPPVGGQVSCTLASLAVGAAPVLSVVVTAPAEGGSISNTASVSGNEADPVGGNNSAVAGTTVTSSTDLSIIKTDSPDPVGVGLNVTYTITVTNNGPSAATGVTVTDTQALGSGPFAFVSATPSQGSCTQTGFPMTCSLGNLSAAGMATITLVVTTSQAGMIGNDASVSGNESDPNMSNNMESETTNVGDVSRLINISTRSMVETGNNVEIAGFIIGGNLPKTFLIRGRGPSMAGAPFNVLGTLQDPRLQLFTKINNVQTMIAQNDEWGDQSDTTCSSMGYTCASAAEISATGLDPCVPNPGQSVPPPNCSRESAVLMTLPPGSYSAILSGVNGQIGVGMVEVFDVDGTTLPKLVNISTRARVLTGDSVMIGGFIVGSGTGNKSILIRARGPSMSGQPFNLTGVLDNPTIELYAPKTAGGGQVKIAENDDWQTQTTGTFCGDPQGPSITCGGVAEITASGLDPCQPNPGQTVAPNNCNLEAALYVTVPPGRYSAIVRGFNNGIGIGLVEIFEGAQ